STEIRNIITYNNLFIYLTDDPPPPRDCASRRGLAEVGSPGPSAVARPHRRSLASPRLASLLVHRRDSATWRGCGAAFPSPDAWTGRMAGPLYRPCLAR